VSPAFGAALRELLAASGMTLGELSRRSHYDVGYLSHVLNGHKPASAVSLSDFEN
jgi:hypothetical protein